MIAVGRRRRHFRLDIFSYFVIFTFITLTGCHPKTSVDTIPWNEIAQQFQNAQQHNEPFQVFPINSDRLSETTSISNVLRMSDDIIPGFNTVVLVVKPNNLLLADKVVKHVREAISTTLHLPVESIKVAKYEASTGLLKLYFIDAEYSNGNDVMLVPASDIVSHLSVEDLQKHVGRIKIVSIRTGEDSAVVQNSNGKAWNPFSTYNLQTWQLALIIASCLFALFCISVVIVFLSSRRMAKDSSTVVEEKQVVVQPVLKPDVSGVNVVQPENKDCYITETDSEHTPSPCRSPLRIKGKGLLERRGSNASLTLDLNRSQENIHYGTPPKECSTEEYLLSAGHRLSRKQLRNALKDVKALHSEFWEIPMNHPEKVEVAGSGTKNRYKTILPNETTRVQIQGNDNENDPLTCYINANYIRGYAAESNAYIATQGPMTHTINDFWNMVWEQKSPIIVMITKLKEKLKVKCEPYVPDHQGHYGGIDVTVLKVIPREGYTIRELWLSSGRESRCVYHVWYTAWPDHKTPDTAKQLLAMALEVEALRHNANGTTKGPTVVHCSAGIGRTGCFIATSIGIQQLLEENMVDILGIVCSLRLDRGGMVQTAEQYEFVYQSLSIFESSMPDKQAGE